MSLKFHPIIFNEAMANAVLSGRKTQTRRVVSPGNSTVLGARVTRNSPQWRGLDLTRAIPRTHSTLMQCLAGDSAPLDMHLDVPWCHPDDEPGDDIWYRVRPIWEPGDLLWGKETWGVGSRPHPYLGAVEGIEYRADDAYLESDIELLPLNTDVSPPDGDETLCEGTGWRSPRHMPRWASRITLRITDVRVQRVQDISQEDAIAEGCRDGGCLHCGASSWPNPCGCDYPVPDHRDAFVSLWDSINAKRGFGWIENPWVWAVTFAERGAA